MLNAVDKMLRQASQARREKRFHDAKRDLGEAIEVCRTSGDRLELARVLTTLGQLERDLHHREAAIHHYEEAVAIYRAEGDILRLAHAIRHVGDIQREAKCPQLAEPCYDEALALYRSHAGTAPLDLANAIRGLAILKNDARENTDAIALWQEARALYASADVETGVVESTQRLALLARDR
jgi:tetratricopeptide (TPR) repeat protein